MIQGWFDLCCKMKLTDINIINFSTNMQLPMKRVDLKKANFLYWPFFLLLKS